MVFFRHAQTLVAAQDFMRVGEQALAKQTSPEGLSLAVLWVNLSRTDRLQAMIGQVTAQKLDKSICSRAAAALRKQDVLCLADPDQLWVLLPDLPSLAHAELAASKLKQALELPLTVDGHTHQLHLQIGIACAPEHGLKMLALLEVAQQAARQAQRAEGGYVLASNAPVRTPEERRALQNELRWALTDNSLQVFYQPQIDLRSQQCVSAEALIRWQRHEDEWVDAGSIADMAEAAGMMYNLTMFVLHTVGRHNHELEKAGFKLQFAINLSASMLDDPNLAQAISDVLDIWNIPAQRIIIEVTESSIIHDVEQALQRFQELRGLGMQLSIDDFGTGYSSLAYLRRFPLNELKIDQVFVRHMLVNPGDDRIVRSVIDLAHNFDLVAVAEGVESLEIAARLETLGCDLTQGYAYSKPLPFEQFLTWLQQPHSGASPSIRPA
jgi:EAL domain-containing protein (putative c-di-GMP-specific phosphodiesterase class I)